MTKKVLIWLILLCFQYFYYGDDGLTSGHLLMNLTRIRNLSQFKWSRRIETICQLYYKELTLYDQGILNIIFSEVSGIL